MELPDKVNPEGKSPDLRLAFNQLVDFVEDLSKEVAILTEQVELLKADRVLGAFKKRTEELIKPKPDPISWSNRLSEPGSWEQIEGKPGYYKDPWGIQRLESLGEVPAEVIRRLAGETIQDKPNEES
jgi:hypothetical protein